MVPLRQRLVARAWVWNDIGVSAASSGSVGTCVAPRSRRVQRRQTAVERGTATLRNVHKHERVVRGSPHQRRRHRLRSTPIASSSVKDAQHLRRRPVTRVVPHARTARPQLAVAQGELLARARAGRQVTWRAGAAQAQGEHAKGEVVDLEVDCVGPVMSHAHTHVHSHTSSRPVCVCVCACARMCVSVCITPSHRPSDVRTPCDGRWVCARACWCGGRHRSTTATGSTTSARPRPHLLHTRALDGVSRWYAAPRPAPWPLASVAPSM